MRKYWNLDLCLANFKSNEEDTYKTTRDDFKATCSDYMRVAREFKDKEPSWITLTEQE